MDGKCSFDTCETDAEMLQTIEHHFVEKDIGLRCLAHGEGVWFA